MFYTYNQNNSGGVFDVDENLAHTVIIEADSESEADVRAESIGIYFDEDYQIDCSCCGTRWNTASSWNTDEVPSMYGEELTKVLDGDFDSYYVYYTQWLRKWTLPHGWIHFKDGSKARIEERQAPQEIGSRQVKELGQ